MKISFYIYIFLQLYFNRINSEEYDYHNSTAWQTLYPSCGGLRQSPIDIKITGMHRIGSGFPLQWHKYENVPITMTLVNNGHTIQLSAQWRNGHTPYIEGGPLIGKYFFEQLHFHWGPNTTSGSEHTINGVSFPLEMHMVHFNKKYETFINATNYPDGLAVVGLLFAVDVGLSEGLNYIFSGFAGIRMPGQRVELNPFPLSIFKSTIASVQFITYTGSLTTPPCSEVVTWIIPIALFKATQKQITRFQSVILAHGDVYNDRPAQRLNSRYIEIFSQWSTFYKADVYKLQPDS